MTSRYFNRFVLINNTNKYNKIFFERNITFVEQYDTPWLTYPTADEILTLTPIPHIWSMGDRFYKLASRYYQDPRLWWIIAWYNRTPTEAHVKTGWIIDVPLPLEAALRLWDK